MTRILVLYYSSYGHIHAMAQAVAEGARSEGAEVALKRVPELVPEEVAKQSGYRTDFDTPIAEVEELADYDGIVFGTPVRFGNMAAQMKQFLDRAGGLWFQDRLVGKVGSVFTSSSTQHGGQEATILSFHLPLLHFGMVVAGLPYSFKGQTETGRITGGSPYGASTLAGPDGAPAEGDLAGARFQGAHVAKIARGLKAVAFGNC
ncbi:NAD(P)H:quinone oxidoreductase [Paenirhodobacter sp.]|uniref:NAD(P)H:quinone oxidoreductase n=1 Tax=Paenirhodobacter sp. TaxID=1965326 RepID=UPI003B4202E7